MNKICVVIPMYNHADLTRKCVDKTLELAGMPVDILVVNDGSKEAYIDDRVQIRNLEKNTGWTNATNQGVLWCSDKYEYIHMQNNDIEPEKDYIKYLYDAIESDKSVGIVSSARKIVFQGKPSYEVCGADLVTGYQRIYKENPPKLIKVHWAPLCSSLIRHEMIRYIGLLDRAMWMWSSDLEYCLRANLNDWVVLVSTDSQVTHTHSVSTLEIKDKEKLLEKDHQVLLRRLGGEYYSRIMKELPLDAKDKVYGKLEFSTYKKELQPA